MDILPWFVGACQDRVLDEVTLHTLISSLAAWHEEFSHGDFCDLVFDQFLLLLASHSSVLRHTLRLLWYVLPKMDPQKVVHILTVTQPSSEVCSTKLAIGTFRLENKYETGHEIKFFFLEPFGSTPLNVPRLLFSFARSMII